MAVVVDKNELEQTYQKMWEESAGVLGPAHPIRTKVTQFKNIFFSILGVTFLKNFRTLILFKIKIMKNQSLIVVEYSHPRFEPIFLVSRERLLTEFSHLNVLLTNFTE